MEAEVYSQVKHNIQRMMNINLDYYKDEQMKRRLDSWLTRTMFQSWNDYFQLVSKNPDEMTRFRNYLTINVTEFFRDPDRWEMLGRSLLPGLVQVASARKFQAGMKVWSAGCSIGVEAYTLSILLEEASHGLPYTILATDLDRGALQKARTRGPYKSEEIKNLSPQQRARCLDCKNGDYFIKDFLAQPILL